MCFSDFTHLELFTGNFPQKINQGLFLINNEFCLKSSFVFLHKYFSFSLDVTRVNKLLQVESSPILFTVILY